MDNIIHLLNICNSNGIRVAQAEVEAKQKIINEETHLLNVIDFCDILNLMLKYSEDEERLYLDIYTLKNKKNLQHISIKHTFKKTNQVKISKRKISKLTFGINQLLSKFDNIDHTLVNPFLLNNVLTIELSASNTEIIKEYFLNKKLFSAYQLTFLMNKLPIKVENKDILKL